MTLDRLSPRVVPAGERVIPLVANGRNPRIFAWVMFAFALIAVLLAFADERLGFRLVLGSVALTGVAIGIGVYVLAGTVKARLVHVDADAPALHFAPPARTTVALILVPASMLIPAVAQLIVDLTGLPTMSSGLIVGRGPYLLGAVGVVTLAIQLWGMRLPSGLILTPDGLLGIRGSGEVRLRWEDLASVGVTAGPVAKLSLSPKGGGSPLLAPARALGSDPNQVAAIVRYYLERPAERELLADGGIAAVRRVEDALRARTA